MTAEPDYRARHIANVVRDFTKVFPWLNRIAVQYDRDPDSDTIWVEVTNDQGHMAIYSYEPGDYDPAIYEIDQHVEGFPGEVMVDVSNEAEP